MRLTSSDCLEIFMISYFFFVLPQLLLEFLHCTINTPPEIRRGFMAYKIMKMLS